MSIIQTVDKLDKKTVAEVEAELVKKGLTKETAKKALKQIKSASPPPNLKEIISLTTALGVPKDSLVFEPTLARGLDYYTGMIFEVIIPEIPIGSFGGGGRYDNLISDLGGPKVPAVGIAFGFDRIVEAVKNLELLESSKTTAKVLVSIFSPEFKTESLKVANSLRKAGINTEVYPANDNIGKQLKYANQMNVPFIIILGEEEKKVGKVTLKDMISGKQETLTLKQLLSKLK